MIHFENIEIKYEDFVAIPSLNLHIKDGEFFTLLGPSGCGKTTLLRSLAGFIDVSNGNIIVDGKDITHFDIEKREIGMVFQNYALFPTMTAYENIAFGLKVDKKSKEFINEKVMELGAMVELSSDQLSKNVSNMSGGQQQRVAIARALAKEPKILVMDEPLSNLDAKLRKSLREDIKKFQRKFGITTIYVTHDQEEALMLSDRIAILNKGQIEQIGSASEIYNNSATEFVCKFIGEANCIPKEKMKHIIGNSIDQFPQANYYIRPEKVKISRQKQETAELSILGHIESKEFYGMYSYYKVNVQDIELTVFQNNINTSPMDINDSVYVSFDMDHILKY